MKIDDLKSKNKEELLAIIETLINHHPSNRILVNHLLNGTKPNLKKTLRQVEKEMHSHNGNYRMAYHYYSLFVHTNPDYNDLLNLSYACLPHFMKDLNTYHDYPNDLVKYKIIYLHLHAHMLGIIFFG
ncbi:MAG: hypothetical protein ABII85_05560 [Bacillota bacterium]